MSSAPPVAASRAAAAAVVHVPALGLDLPVLMEVPDAGALGGFSRYASYRAAREGAMPTLRIGQRLRVPTATWLDQLGLAYEAVQP